MNGPIRSAGVGVAVAFALLAIVTVWHQAIAGPGYRDDLRNPRGVATFEDRGPILAWDGTTLADSAPEGNGVRRTYPLGAVTAHPVGYASRIFGTTGLEDARSSALRPTSEGSIESLVRRLLGREPQGESLQTTLDPRVQRVAVDVLGDQRGAIVALDATNGAIVAWVSSPSFDPNSLTGPDALTTGAELAARPDQPLVDRVRSALYPPGSTFKILVAAAALEAGLTPDTDLDDLAVYEAPGTETPIGNAQEGPCLRGDVISLADAMRVSCNTAFAALGVDLGAAALAETTGAAGFESAVPFDLATAISTIGDTDELADNPPALAQAAIGGRDVRVTPLQMALLAAAITNSGRAPMPRIDASDTIRPGMAMFSEAVAEDLRSMMIGVVDAGTGTAAAVPGAIVGGKTGTADLPDAAPHTWFVAFAEHEGGRLALAVVVENGGDLGDDGTGGRVAAPIARDVIEAWMGSRS